MRKIVGVSMLFLCILGAVLLGLSFQSETNQILYLFAGIMLFALAFFSFQGMNAYLLFMKEKAEQAENEVPCKACGLPIYKNDTVCPYCKKEQPKNPK